MRSLRPARRHLLPVLALLLVPGLALARPVSRVLDLKAGDAQFFPARSAVVVQVDDPSVATAELLPSGEVFLQARKAGRALMLIWSEGAVLGFRVRVRETGGALPERTATEAGLTAVRKACRGVRTEGSPARLLSAEVTTSGCRDALRSLLEGDSFLAGDLRLVFSVEVLQAQLEELRGRLRERVRPGALELSYAGAALRLKGTVTEAERAALMQTLYETAVGPVIFEDQLQLAPPSEAPTRGAPEAPASAEPGSRELPAEAVEVERGAAPAARNPAR